MDCIGLEWSGVDVFVLVFVLVFVRVCVGESDGDSSGWFSSHLVLQREECGLVQPCVPKVAQGPHPDAPHPIHQGRVQVLRARCQGSEVCRCVSVSVCVCEHLCVSVREREREGE